MKYRVIRAREDRIEERINTLIEEGWKPLGGVSAVDLRTQTVLTCFQAMIKEE